jgi:signal transduction histidine kinase
MAVELLPEAGVERRPELEHEAARSLAEIDGLVEEILTASRLEAQPEGSLQRTSFDLLQLVREEAELGGIEVSGPPTPILADERLLRRAVRNLIENALRHGAPPVEATVSTPSGFAEVRVSDHGTGVPEAERERIFEPFYRRPGKSEAESGTGLGLALVRRIARAHGGEARVESLPGGGIVFVLRLGV